MYANIFTKTLRDRWAIMVYGAIGVGLLLLLVMGVYDGIDLSVYYELPEAITSAMGINLEIGGTAGLAYGAMFGFMGAIAFGGMAISVGSGTIAGEERDGTLEILLGNPQSRTTVLASKLAGLVALVAFAGLLVWGAGLLVPAILGSDMTGVDVGAISVHLAANALLWGMVAFAIGAATGNRTTASGVAAGVMVLSWLATSLLPLVDSVSGLAKVSPWYYYNGSDPLVHGVDWGHLSVLLGLSALLAAVALVRFRARDLKVGGSTVTILDRLRANPHTQRIAERIAGTALVSNLTTKTISDHRGLAVAMTVILFYASLLLTPMYNILPDAMTDLMSSLPDALLAAVGGVDMATPAGWIQGELFSLVVPICFIAVLAVIGARAIAGEEADHTMGLLLANPVSRTKVVTGKAFAMIAYAIILGALTWAGTAVGIILGGLDVSIGNVAAISALGALLGLVFGGVALALSAATGRVHIAVAGAAGLGVLTWIMQSFLPLSASLKGWAVLSPFHYYLGSDPLADGMAWGDAGILAAIFAILVAVAIPLFNRRDLVG